jgi:prepilin-type N-terminal cleavage/methylation domain-containing protein
VKTTRGFTLVELLIVVAVISIIAAIATPGLLRARISASESSAIASLRTIGNAQATFAHSCANGLYAASLDVLGSGPSGQQPFVSEDLGYAASVVKSGYTFSLTGTLSTGVAACNGTTSLASGYHSWADPYTPTPAHGVRYFASNTTNTIWQSTSTLSGISDTGSPSGATPIQ